jgi:hypothetical protein
MLSVGIRNKDLPEVIACHQTDNLFYPLGIQFVEDVVKQE